MMIEESKPKRKFPIPPPPVADGKIAERTTWWFRNFLRMIAKFRLVRMKVNGKENVPKTGKGVVVPMHTSFIDPLIIWGSFRRLFPIVAAAGLWKYRAVRWLMNRLGMIPVARSDEEWRKWTYKQMDRMLEKELLLGVYTQGKISRDGSIGWMATSAARLAIKHGCKIYPVATQGIDKVLPVGGKFPRLFKKVIVDILVVDPADYDNDPKKTTEAIRQLLSEVSGAKLAHL